MGSGSGSGEGSGAAIPPTSDGMWNVFYAMVLERWYLSLLHVAYLPALWFMYGPHRETDSSDTWAFVLGIIALVPLSERLGFVTEQLALHQGEFVAGLINVTFGNVPELVMTIVCIYHSQTKMAMRLLLGGVLSNLLLVLGLSFLAGGIRHRQQRFNTVVSHALLAALLFIASAIACVTALPSTKVTLYLENKQAKETDRVLEQHNSERTYVDDSHAGACHPSPAPRAHERSCSRRSSHRAGRAHAYTLLAHMRARPAC